MAKLFLCLILFSSCTFISKFHSAPKTYFKSLQEQPFDVIIVPGYPHFENGWDRVVKMRVIWANYLFKKGYTKNIIFSGSSVYSPFTESKVMALYAMALGVPQANIFTEEKAEHSTENTYYSYLIARKQGFKKIALATDQFQTDNLRAFIRKFSLDIKLLPIIIDTLYTLEIDEPKIDASSARATNYVSIVQRQSLYTRIRGTFGKHIIWHEEDLKKKKYRRRFKKRMIPAGS